MAYAHAVNLVNEFDPDSIPVWLRLLCNADVMKRKPYYPETFGLENIYITPEGNVVEMIEEDN